MVVWRPVAWQSSMMSKAVLAEPITRTDWMGCEISLTGLFIKVISNAISSPTRILGIGTL